MRIVYQGNYLHQHCTEVHVARELERLGHDVVRFQEDPTGVGARNFRGIADRLMYLTGAVGTEPKADLFLWTRTWGMPPEATHLWRALESYGIKTASYHLDLYWGLEREARMDKDPFWTTQYVFTPDGDPVSAKKFAEAGINHHFMPPAVVSDECVAGVYRAEMDHDVVFTGSGCGRYHDVEYPFRCELLAWLRATYGDRFCHYGLNGDRETVRNQQLNDLFASAKVVVGDSLSLPGHQRYTSDRLFETTGRGGMLLYPRTSATEFLETDLGYDGTKLWWYYPDDLGQLQRSIEYLLDADGMRDLIRKSGQAFTRTHHTYKHRLEIAMNVMFGG